MKYVAALFMSISSVIHLLFFKLESIDFMKPEVLLKFDLDSTSGAFVETWAFNQGFYNLFLAIGLILATICIFKFKNKSHVVLANFILVTMIFAGLVLYISVPAKLAAALIQAVPAFIAVVTLNIFNNSTKV